MPNEHIDRIDTLEGDERWGQLERIVRMVRIGGLTSTDWSILDEALANLSLGPGDALSGEPNLRLVRRRPQLVRGTRSYVDVRCEYRRRHAEPVWEGDSSVQPVRTQRDRHSNPIKLTYEYPDDYKYEPQLAGEEVNTVKEVSTTKSMTTLIGLFHGETTDPLEVVNETINKLNSTDWYETGDARQWKVIREPFEFFMLNPASGNPIWEFRPVVVRDPDGWDPDIVFIDPHTNEPPDDVLDQDDAHLEDVELLDEIDFNTEFQGAPF